MKVKIKIRKLEKIIKKKINSQQSIKFIKTCLKDNNLPNYNNLIQVFRFKLYKKCLHHTKFYNDWQNKILNKGITFKRKVGKDLDKKLNEQKILLKNSLTSLLFIFIDNFIKKEISEFIEKTR